MKDFDPGKMGERIKTLREGLGLRQEDIAGMMFMRRETYNTIENGVRQLKAAEIVQLADILHTSTDYILRGKKTENLTMIDEIGLDNDSIEKLKQMSARITAWNELNERLEKLSNERLPVAINSPEEDKYRKDRNALVDEYHSRITDVDGALKIIKALNIIIHADNLRTLSTELVRYVDDSCSKISYCRVSDKGIEVEDIPVDSIVWGDSVSQMGDSLLPSKALREAQLSIVAGELRRLRDSFNAKDGGKQ